MIKDLAGLFAVILSLGIPISAIICTAINSIKKRRNDTELRKTIVENNTDVETAKVILTELTPDNKQSKKFSNLTAGLTFIGIALGALIPLLCGLSLEQVDGGLILAGFIALGIGIALLASFLIIWKLKAKDEAYETPDNEEEK